MEHNQEIMEQFLKLLSENGRAGQSEDLSRLLFYMDGMNRQLDAVRQELQTVRVQLAQAQDTLSKMFAISRLASKSLTFWVIPVGIPPHFLNRFQISTV